MVIYRSLISPYARNLLMIATSHIVLCVILGLSKQPVEDVKLLIPRIKLNIADIIGLMVLKTHVFHAKVNLFLTRFLVNVNLKAQATLSMK